ncbi:MAG TPA: hypothetical protein VIN59_00085 [Alphaproteobacteria bacterium]
MTSQPITILICDDTPSWLDQHKQVIAYALKDLNIEADVQTFTDGLGAYQYLTDRGNADGILLWTDQQMPRMKGTDLLQSLYFEDLLPPQSIICSASDRWEIEGLMKEGPIGVTYVPKGADYLKGARDALTMHLRTLTNSQPAVTLKIKPSSP